MVNFSVNIKDRCFRLRTSAWRRGATILLFAAGGLVACGSRADTAEASIPEQRQVGPTLRMDYARESAGNDVGAFMYFIPLISPEPVAAYSTPGATHQARVTSASRQQSETAFTTTCDFEFSGDGSQEDVFDLARTIQRHEQQLKAGAILDKQLRSITVSGPGHGRVEVKGTIANGVPTVNQVRLRFNADGQTSPVSIGLCDIHYHEGDYRLKNELVARVNTLTFRREPGQPKMEVTVGSVKSKGAGEGIWQNFKGRIKGAAANMLINPLPVEVAGNDTMLNFGLALSTGATSFTFPHAAHLIENQR
jgi:hypothetical protein